MLLNQILPFTIHEKIQNSHSKLMNLKYQLLRGMTNFSYLVDNIQYNIFKIILNLKKYGEKNDNSSITIYVNKITIIIF